MGQMLFFAVFRSKYLEKNTELRKTAPVELIYISEAFDQALFEK